MFRFRIVQSRQRLFGSSSIGSAYKHATPVINTPRLSRRVSIVHKAYFTQPTLFMRNEQGMGGIFGNMPVNSQAATPEESSKVDADDILPSDDVLRAISQKEKSQLNSKLAYRVTTLLLDAQHQGMTQDVKGDDWTTLKNAVLAAANNDVASLRTLASILLRYSKDGSVCSLLLYRILTPPGITRDLDKAETLLSQLAEDKEQIPLYLRERNDVQRALSLWENVGAAGHPTGYTEIGKVYLMSRGGVAQDLTKAYEYLEKAAMAKDAEAQYILGVMLTQGQGPTGKPEKTQAFSWFEKSASQGMPTALYNTGHCYFMGDGVEKDERRAVEYWIMASERNVPPAMINLGKFYAYGRGGLAKDMDKARALWSRLADREDVFGESARELLKETA
ncbi:hypothetical protein BDF22DRAFT_675091 [Syncephalis plumigaleata]|nr:hypothetical protein BDF22DRAFT_675091 [Syncephalis plumigaleata]